jgi:hypothetical protein
MRDGKEPVSKIATSHIPDFKDAASLKELIHCIRYSLAIEFSLY